MTAILRFATLIVVKIVKFVYDCIKLIFAKYWFRRIYDQVRRKGKETFVDYDNQYNAIKTTLIKNTEFKVKKKCNNAIQNLINLKYLIINRKQSKLNNYL